MHWGAIYVVIIVVVILRMSTIYIAFVIFVTLILDHTLGRLKPWELNSAQELLLGALRDRVIRLWDLNPASTKSRKVWIVVVCAVIKPFIILWIILRELKGD